MINAGEHRTVHQLQPYVLNPSTPQYTRLQTTLGSFISFGQHLAQEVWGLWTGIIRAKQVNTQPSSGVVGRHVGGSGPMPSPALYTENVPRDSIGVLVRSETCRTPDRGPQRRTAERVGRSRGLQRSGRSKREVSGEAARCHWLHTHTHVHTNIMYTLGCPPYTHTQTHTIPQAWRQTLTTKPL